MSKELTPWFPMRVKPARIGVYNVSCRAHDQSGAWYAKWDGFRFHWYAKHPNDILSSDHGGNDRTQSWRGLAKKP
jgi:hypothetical protein